MAKKQAKPPRDRGHQARAKPHPLTVLAVILLACCGLSVLAVLFAPNTTPTPTAAAQLSSMTPSPEVSTAQSVGVVPLAATIPPTNTAQAAPATNTPAPTQLPDSPQPTAVPFEAYESLLLEAIKKPNLPKVVSLRVADGRASGGERAVIIAYETDQTTQQAFNDEWIAMLDVLGKAIQQHSLDVDSVALAFGGADTEAYGIFTVTIKDVMAYSSGKITRRDLLNQAKFAQMPGYPASAKATQTPVYVVVTNTPRPAAPAVRVQPTQPPPAGACPAPKPRNCTECRAIGLSPQQCAACGLDRDKDGQACYDDK